MGSIPYTPHDQSKLDEQTEKMDDSSSLYIVCQGDYSDHPAPKDYRDPWLQRVVDLGYLVDVLQNKHRNLRDRWSEEGSERVSQALEHKTLIWDDKENQVDEQRQRALHFVQHSNQNEHRRNWLGKLSGRLFRGSNTSSPRGKSVVSDAPSQPATIPLTQCQPAPHSLPTRRLRRTPAIRELSPSPTPPLRTLPSDGSSSTASNSNCHRRVVSEPTPRSPRQLFFNAFMSDVVGDVSSSIHISEMSGPSCSPSLDASRLGERPRGISHVTMPPFSSPSSSTSSSDFSSPPTPPPKESTPPRSKQFAAKRSAYYSPLDLLRYHPQSEFGTESAHKTPIQALQARLPPDEAPTVRSTGSLRAQHVTTLPKRQASCTATPILERPGSPESCTCQQISCTDDIAFSPFRARLMNGAGYFHVKLISEDQGDGCTVETWKIYSCDECNRQSRPPGTRVNSIVSESVTSTHLDSRLSSEDIDYDAYITADEGFEDNDDS